MIRRQRFIKEVYERCGHDAKKKLERVNALQDVGENQEIKQISSLMEFQSSRINPNLVDYHEMIETTLNNHAHKEEKLISEITKPASFEVEDISKSGFQYVRNNEFISQLLDIDPQRHKVIENDWQDEKIVAKLENNLDILLR